MIDLLPLLKEMITASGLSGFEGPIRRIIQQAWEPLTDALSVSKIGSLHGFKQGAGTEPRRRVLISAHMDAIGMMVTQIRDGLMHVTEIGGLDHRILPGSRLPCTAGRTCRGWLSSRRLICCPIRWEMVRSR